MPKRRFQSTAFDAAFERSLNLHRYTIRKSYASFDQDDRIPIPIQIFLWRQSK